MASGNILFVLTPLSSVPPATVAATHDTLFDTTDVPLVGFPVLDFDGAADEHADWPVVIPSQYAGTLGFTFQYIYAMSGTDVDLVDMEFRVLHLADTDVIPTNLGMDGLTAVSIQDTPVVTVTASKVAYSPTGALAKANFSSAAAGQYVMIRATREISAAANADDLQLLAVYVTET